VRDDVRASEAVIASHLDKSELAAAVTETVRSYGEELLGYLTGVLRDPSAAEETFADVCEDLWKGIDSFRRECSMRTWAYRLALSRVRRFKESAYVRRVRQFESEELSLLVDSVRSMTSVLYEQARQSAVQRFRDSLDAEEQTLLSLRLDRGLSWREVAHVFAGDEIDLDEAAVRKRFERIKGKLRAMAVKDGLIDG
jgi:RNA polymerase sigma-70 factor, ECF subfamily